MSLSIIAINLVVIFGFISTTTTKIWYIFENCSFVGWKSLDEHDWNAILTIFNKFKIYRNSWKCMQTVGNIQTIGFIWDAFVNWWFFSFSLANEFFVTVKIAIFFIFLANPCFYEKEIREKKFALSSSFFSKIQLFAQHFYILKWNFAWELINLIVVNKFNHSTTHMT